MILGDTAYKMGRPAIISVKEGSKRELMKITGNPAQGPENGNTWEVERGIEGTTPESFTTAATIEQVITVGGLQDNIAYMLNAGLRTQYPSAGKLFMQFDSGWQLGVYNPSTSSWNNFSPIFDVIEVNELNFAWVNQGTATLDTTDGASEISAAGSGAYDVHMRVQNVSAFTPTSPPYDVTWAFIPMLTPVSPSSCGFVFRESGTGKFIFFNLLYDETTSLTKTDLVLSVDKFDSPTVFNSNYTIVDANIIKSSIYWFRLRDNGGVGTLEFLVSGDGKNYRRIYSVSRTDFLAGGPDQFGYAINANALTGKAEMNVLSFWKRATT
jgi:hypothetical protein